MLGGATRRAARALIVDDDRLLVPLLERGLRYEEFDVACAYCAADAVATVRRPISGNIARARFPGACRRPVLDQDR
jgi:ActR/RegA family two-component response regulator